MRQEANIFPVCATDREPDRDRKGTFVSFVSSFFTKAVFLQDCFCNFAVTDLSAASFCLIRLFRNLR